jgi:hypothetical protein
MGNYIHVTGWMWDSSSPVTVEVRKTPSSYIVRYNLSSDSLEMSLKRDVLVSLRDKINNALLDDTEPEPPTPPVD